MRGKTTCETLKAIRKQVADANGIPYEPHVCTYKGPCSGTCPACEAEARYIEAELAKRQKAKQPVNIVGVAKDKMPEPTSFIQAVAAAATITAVMTFTALPVDAVAQTTDSTRIETSNLVRVTGVVKSGTDVLSGASITVKGTDRQTKSNEKGEFSIDAAIGDVLVVSYSGYEQKEVKVTANNEMRITLEVDKSTESTYCRRRTIGAVSSLTGNQNPLYVVDGVPLNSDSSNPLASVNPKEIQSMEVLKDSSAIAKYVKDYPQAKNGIILISTQKRPWHVRAARKVKRVVTSPVWGTKRLYRRIYRYWVVNF